MKYLLLLLLSTVSLADTSITNLPVGTAADTSSVDVFPFVNVTTNTTEQMTLWDLINLPPVVSTYAPIASPTLTGTVTATGQIKANTGLTVGTNTILNSELFLLSSVASNSGSYLHFQKNGSGDGLFGYDSALRGGSGTDYDIDLEAYGSFGIYTGSGQTLGFKVDSSQNSTFFGSAVAGPGNVGNPGSMNTSPTLGLALSAKTGSSYDFAIVNAANTATVLNVPTGTNNVTVNGTLTGNGDLYAGGSASANAGMTQVNTIGVAQTINASATGSFGSISGKNGLLLVSNQTTGGFALFILTGGTPTFTEISEGAAAIGTVFTTTSGHASTVNVYISGSNLTVQNNLAGNDSFLLTFFRAG